MILHLFCCLFCWGGFFLCVCLCFLFLFFLNLYDNNHLKIFFKKMSKWCSWWCSLGHCTTSSHCRVGCRVGWSRSRFEKCNCRSRFVLYLMNLIYWSAVIDCFFDKYIYTKFFAQFVNFEKKTKESWLGELRSVLHRVGDERGALG